MSSTSSGAPPPQRFGEANPTTFTTALVSEGLHPATLIHVEEGVTQNGIDYADFFFAIVGGVNEGAIVRQREWTGSSSHQAQAIFQKKRAKLFQICGGAESVIEFEQLFGWKLLINVKHEVRRNYIPRTIDNKVNYWTEWREDAVLAGGGKNV